MKKSIALACLALLGFAGPAAADFTGPTAPANWTVTNTGTLTGGSPTLGGATFSSTQLVMTGSNSQSPSGFSPSCSGGFFGTLGPCQLQVTTNQAGTYSFNWSYVTSDTAGAGADTFGVIVDSTRIALTELAGGNSQSGSESFAAASSFGWFINCGDCIGGSATSTVSSFAFVAAIPEPETYALMVAGVLGIAVRLRARRARAG